MKISTSWLAQYVDLSNISNAALAHKLTMTGTNVETYSSKSDSLKNIVIGRIVSIEKHKNADNLSVCQVDIKTKTVQIITSAKNIKLNALIPVCLEGATTANGLKIKKSKFRGEVSNGMMCSLEELGLSKADYPYADENGIFLIDEPNCKEGQTVCEAFDLDDTIFELEITSNRPDCLSATGIAREVCASFNVPFNLKQPKNFCEAKNGNDCFKVEVNSKNCLRYMAKVVENVKVEPSPRWLKKLLEACGIKPINNIVDITNYVLLEFGVPMHAFDLNALEGNKIVVRQAQNDETLETLMHTTATLTENDLVVCDSKKPLAVAGVIGGVDSSVKNNTSAVLFEVACFDKNCIRKTAQKISARTESSIRFEKGINPDCCEQSMNRACELVEMLQIGKVAQPTTDIINHENLPVTVKFDENKINELIGFDLSKNEMIEILKLLDFKIENNKIIVPPHRIDIENCADVAEEIARIYGYDKIEPVALKFKIEPKQNNFWLFENKLRQILTSFGCDETFSYSFSNVAEIEKTGLDVETELKKAVEIANPFGEETRFLKTTTIPSMMESLAFNFKNKQKAAWLFEIGRTYEMIEKNKPIEPKKLTIGLYGNSADFFTMKGMIESMFDCLKIKKLEFKPIKQMPFHDFAGCEISNNSATLGQFGEIHPNICDNFKLSCKVFVAVLNLEPIFELKSEIVTLKPISKFPPSSFDLTLVCNENLTCGEIEREIKKSVGDVLKSCRIFSVYKDNNSNDNLKSVSFNIVLQSQTHTLEKTEIDEIVKKLISKLELIGAKLKTL